MSDTRDPDDDDYYEEDVSNAQEPRSSINEEYVNMSDDDEDPYEREPRRIWPWVIAALAVIVALVVAIVVGNIGDGDPFGNGDSTTTSSSAPTSTPPTSTPAAAPAPSDEGPTAEATMADGTLATLPLVEGGPTVIGDSTGFADTPPVVSNELRDKCGVLFNWKSLYDCVETHDLDWYRDAVNRFAPETGFNWNDVKLWSEAMPTERTSFILIANLSEAEMSDAQARNQKEVRDLLPGEVTSGPNKGKAVVDVTPIVRHSCIVNTRGQEVDQLNQFADCKKQVRVSLAPLVLDKDGKVKGYRGNAGVFVDCYNIWWLTRIVRTPPPPPPASTPPPPPPCEGPPNVCQPPCPPGSPGCTPPCTVNCQPPCTVNCEPPCTVNCEPPCTVNCQPCPPERCPPPKDPNAGPPAPPGVTPMPPPPGEPETEEPVEEDPIDTSVETDAPIVPDEPVREDPPEVISEMPGEVEEPSDGGIGDPDGA